MRTFLDLLQTHVCNEFDISHNPNDTFDKNKYYVKKNNGETITFVFDANSQGTYLKIITTRYGEYIASTEAMFNLTENDHINEIVRYCS